MKDICIDGKNMRKINKIFIICVIISCIALAATGCAKSYTSHANPVSGITIAPEIDDLSGTNHGGNYYYIADRNTGVVYLCYEFSRRAGLTVALNADGSPVTVDQLKKKVE